MNLNELNKKQVPIVKIDEKLNALAGKVLFPDKLELANRMLKNKGLPKLK